jgi:CheY-like chemotaxis protein
MANSASIALLFAPRSGMNLAEDTPRPIPHFYMKKLRGKIILIDDEKFEKKILLLALKEIDAKIELEYFYDPEEALEHLKKTNDNIFLIISDMNMPKMNGLELKHAIDSDRKLKKKAVPFIFSSTSVTRSQLEEAYDYRLQGYFIKPNDVKGMAQQLKKIIDYWSESIHPGCGYI